MNYVNGIFRKNWFRRIGSVLTVFGALLFASSAFFGCGDVEFVATKKPVDGFEVSPPDDGGSSGNGDSGGGDNGGGDNSGGNNGNGDNGGGDNGGGNNGNGDNGGGDNGGGDNGGSCGCDDHSSDDDSSDDDSSEDGPSNDDDHHSGTCPRHGKDRDPKPVCGVNSIDEIGQVVVNIKEYDAKPGKKNSAEITGALGSLNLLKLEEGIIIQSDKRIKVKQIRLVLEKEGNFIATNFDQIFPLKTPSGQQSGVKILLPNKTVLEPGVQYLLTADIDLQFQIVLTGSQKCILKPVIHNAKIEVYDESQF